MTSERGSALLLEADAAERGAAEGVLAESGLGVAVVNSAELALRHLELYPTDVVVADADLPGSGVELLRKVNALAPETPVILTSARGDLRAAVAAMRAGAADFLARPLSSAELAHAVNKALTATEQVRDSAPVLPLGGALLGDSRAIREVYATVRRAAPTLSTVLVRGESGTGKELVARLIHDHSPRADGPFVRVHCAALPDALLESELFGYEKGAFTGANTQAKGKFEIAAGGTIFLDEIGDISPKLQADLLRVLQEKRFYRLGGTNEVQVDVRVIAATNKDLAEEVREGRFRDDLYYRLNVIEIQIPPLRQRREDIPLLARHLLERLSSECGKELSGLNEDALKVLLSYDWPGNVRELENAIERAVVTCRGRQLTADDFSFLAQAVEARTNFTVPAIPLQELEKLAVQAALERSSGNVKEAAQALGIDRSTMYEKIKRYEIER